VAELDTWLGELKLSGYEVIEIDHHLDEMNPSILISPRGYQGKRTVIILRPYVPFDWPWSLIVTETKVDSEEKEFEEFDEMADWVMGKLREWDD
jgi:hypothetical protein